MHHQVRGDSRTLVVSSTFVFALAKVSNTRSVLEHVLTGRVIPSNRRVGEEYSPIGQSMFLDSDRGLTTLVSRRFVSSRAELTRHSVFHWTILLCVVNFGYYIVLSHHFIIKHTKPFVTSQLRQLKKKFREPIQNIITHYSMC